MARKYVSAPSVDDKLLDEARARAEVAGARLREAEHGDPLSPGWDAEYEAATAAARAASRRVEALEQLRAAQVERGGQREAAVKASQKDLKAIAAGLSASRDQIAAAAAEHLRSLAALASAAAEHNALLAEGRTLLAERGLRVRDDLADDGAEQAEGVLDGPGLRAGGTDWLPVPGAAIVAHALRQVYGRESPLHPLADVGKYAWRPNEIEARPDGLKVPTLADAGGHRPGAGDRPQRAGHRPGAATEDSQRGCQRLPPRPTAREEDTMMDQDGLDRLVDAVHRAHDPGPGHRALRRGRLRHLRRRG